LRNFQHQLGKLKHLFTNPFEESGDRWMNYLTKDCFYKCAQTMFRSIQFAVNRKEDNLLPSQLAKHICGFKNYQKNQNSVYRNSNFEDKLIRIYQRNTQNPNRKESEFIRTKIRILSEKISESLSFFSF